MKVSKKKLMLLIAQALEVKKNKVNINSKMDDFEEWDSLGQLSILSKIDEELGGKVASIRKLSDCFTVRDFIKILDKSDLIKY